MIRLVSPSFDATTERYVRYLLSELVPFTIVITAQPNRTKENHAGK